jgi:hypothetical protein
VPALALLDVWSDVIIERGRIEGAFAPVEYERRLAELFAKPVSQYRSPTTP